MEDEPEISIRPYRVEDAPALHEAALSSVAEMNTFMPWCHPELKLEEVRSWLETQVWAFQELTAYEHAIVNGAGDYLGGCGLNRIDSFYRHANLGYWVRSSATRRGVATAAIGQLVTWGFENTDLIRLEVIVSTKNIPSLRTAEKAGAVREGTLRDRLLLHGTAHDAAVFSFVRRDWEGRS